MSQSNGPPDNPVREIKSSLRRELRLRRRELDPDWRREAAVSLASRLMKKWREAGQPDVAAYSAGPFEPDIAAFLEAALAAKGALWFPRVLPAGEEMELRRITAMESLRPGFRGILEPQVDASEDVLPPSPWWLLCPGVAFDATGRRLGQGGGHYDRLLESLDGGFASIGICWDFQVVDGIPAEDHDRGVGFVATEARWIEGPEPLAP